MINSGNEVEPSKVSLIGARVILRPWRSDDKHSLLENANNRNVAINLRDQFPYPYTDIDAVEWLNTTTTSTFGRNQYFAIEVENKAVGGISIEFGKDIHRYTAELGYWLGESYWNRGLMTEAIKLMKDYAFDTFPQLQRLYSVPLSNNLSSARVLEKVRFQCEGRLRKSVVNRDGKILDQFVYSVVRE